MADVVDPLRLWVAQNHPDDLPVLYRFNPVTNSSDLPAMTPEAVALWELRLGEFAEAMATDG